VVALGGKIVREEGELELALELITEQLDMRSLHCPKFRCIIDIPHLRA
jgi:hypothetical protein